MRPQKDDFHLKGHSKTHIQVRIYPLHMSEKASLRFGTNWKSTVSNLMVYISKYN